MSFTQPKQFKITIMQFSTKFLAVLWAVLLIFAQQSLLAQRNCGTMHHLEQQIADNPKLLKMHEQHQQNVQAWEQHNPGIERGGITIPVVVHVVYANSTQNITLAQIQTQIDVLNADFARLNADAVNTPAGFAGVAAPTNFQFCLAQQDPNGAPSNGVNRVATTSTGFSDNDAIKFLDLNGSGVNEGGASAWDPSRYFNIWVGKLNGGLLGYAQFPSAGNASTFGIAIDYRYFGTIGTVQAPYNLGRTVTHEVGHCFGLFHIWGDDGGSCSGSDEITDTPNQADATGGSPSFPQFDTCSPSGNGYMFMNYMDYSDDDALNMFTTKQVQRMQASYNNYTYLNSLANSTVCNSPTTTTNDAGIIDIVAPDGDICSGSFAPIVRLKNFGSATLTSVKIYYRIDSNTAIQYDWTGSLASNAIVNVTLPTMTATNGNHTFTSYTQLPNGVTDGAASNDSNSSNFSITSGTAGVNIPLFEGFESPNAPNNGWTVGNYDSDITWARTTAAKKSGVASIKMDNFNYTAAGEVGSSLSDDLISPAINIGAMQNATLTFQVAYASYSDPSGPNTTWDSLQVAIVPACGSGSGYLLYNKYSSALATAPNTTNEFVPTNSQWRLETLDLTPYTSLGSAYIVFRNISHYENNLYIDDVNINGIFVGENVVNQAGIQLAILPNPFNNSATIRYTTDQAADVSITITDVMGRNIKTINQGTQAAGSYDFSIDDTLIPTAGVYVAQVRIGDQVITKKMIKQ